MPCNSGPSYGQEYDAIYNPPPWKIEEEKQKIREWNQVTKNIEADQKEKQMSKKKNKAIKEHEQEQREQFEKNQKDLMDYIVSEDDEERRRGLNIFAQRLLSSLDQMIDEHIVDGHPDATAELCSRIKYLGEDHFTDLMCHVIREDKGKGKKRQAIELLYWHQIHKKYDELRNA